MASDRKPETTYANHHLGPLAADPWGELEPESAVWQDAVRRAWRLDGGSDADFELLFSRPSAKDRYQEY